MISSALVAILVQMGMKLLGYNFIAKTSIAGLTEWSKSTKTHFDDKVTEAAAEALGVEHDDLKEFIANYQKTP